MSRFFFNMSRTIWDAACDLLMNELAFRLRKDYRPSAHRPQWRLRDFAEALTLRRCARPGALHALSSHQSPTVCIISREAGEISYAAHTAPRLHHAGNAAHGILAAGDTRSARDVVHAENSMTWWRFQESLRGSSG